MPLIALPSISFPGDKLSVFDPLMADLGYDINHNSVDATRPDGIGNVTCNAVLSRRHNDGSNQLGYLTSSGVPYADYTGFESPNPASTVPLGAEYDFSLLQPDFWQPLTYFNGATTTTQSFVGAQWGEVTPFAMKSGSQYRPFIARYGPALYGSNDYKQEAQELINISARLDDTEKMIAEYWANGPHTELPPGHWDLFGQYVSARDNHTVDEDAKMFFALTAAIHDAGIAAWDAKRYWDSVRPVTSIPYLYDGHTIQCWGGPFLGTVSMDGANWLPYQPSTFPTPPFPSYISGHSTFSAAGATILANWTGSDVFGDSVTFAPGSSLIEPGVTPAAGITLVWETFSDASNQAGISPRYGGIHFKADDLTGRAVGRMIGRQAWLKALTYFDGTAR